jgi:hypothetical protein
MIQATTPLTRAGLRLSIPALSRVRPFSCSARVTVKVLELFIELLDMRIADLRSSEIIGTYWCHIPILDGTSDGKFDASNVKSSVEQGNRLLVNDRVGIVVAEISLNIT